MQSLKLGARAVLAFLMAQPALADVTPEDVWQNWQEIYDDTGGRLSTASVARDGDTLVIRGLKNTVDTLSNKSEVTIDELRLRDLGDGTVEVTMSDEAQFSSETPGVEGAKAMGARGRAVMPDALGTVSGTADDMAYVFEMPRLDLVIEPTENGEVAGKVELMLSDGVSHYHLTGPADAKVLEGRFEAASAALNLVVGEAGNTFQGALNVADISAHMAGSFAGIEEAELADALAKGFALDLGLGFGALNYDLDVTDAAAPARLVGGSEGGDVQIAMDAARLLFAGSGQKVTASFSGADLPLPEVSLSYDESGFNLTLPIGKADAPQDFTFLTKIVKLQIAEGLWGLVDPTGVLPHDPATLVIDTSGQARLTSDLMATAEGAQPDGELHALSINELTARFGGAELTGGGSLAFDNTDRTTFDGVPAPTGKLELKLLGGNALLDKLVTLGVLSPEEAMGARMMLAMFAKVGPGADELTSVLEFKDKHVFANGQQLQ